MSCIVINSDGTEEYLGEWDSVEEGLTELRREGYGIVFDVSRVPNELKDDPRLKEFELIVTVHMKDAEFRKGVCLHEAAHAEYTEIMGLSDYVKFVPPFAWMKNGDLTYSNAKISGKDENDEFQIDDSQVVPYIKTIAAAKIVEEQLLTNPTGGWGYDDADLEELFQQMKAQGVSREKYNKWRVQARQEIVRDLRNLEFRARLWKRAHFFQHILEQAIYGQSELRKAA